MTRILSAIGCTALVAHSFAAPVHAEDLKSCDAALIRRIDTGTASKATQIAILSEATQGEFSSRQNAIAGGGSAMYGGIPIGGNVDWNTFDQQRREFLNRYRLDYTSNESATWLRIDVSPEAYKSYETCIGLVMNKRGTYLRAIVTPGDDNNFALRAAFYAVADDTKSRSITMRATNANIQFSGSAKHKYNKDGSVTLSNLKGSFDIPLVVSRLNKGSPVTITASMSPPTPDGAATLAIPKVPVVYERKVVESRLFERFTTFNRGAHAQFGTNEKVCVPAESDQALVPSFKLDITRAEAQTQRWHSGQPGDVTFDRFEGGEKQVCVVPRGGLGNESGWQVVGLVVPGERWDWVEMSTGQGPKVVQGNLKKVLSQKW